MNRIAFNVNNNEVLITDSRKKSIKKVSLNGEEISEFKNENNTFQSPYCICVNSLHEICVYDQHLNSIFLFDQQFERTCDLNLNNYFPSDKQNISFMIFDTQNPSYLYFTITSENRVNLVDVKAKMFLKETHIDSPYDIKVDIQHLYLTSSTSYSYDSIDKKFGSIMTGSNCIFILNKKSFELVRKIKLLNWVKPKGLHVDLNGFIWTTAFKMDDDSELLNLFILNQNGEIINSIKLNFKVFSDFFLIERKILFCVGNCLKLVKFD